MTTPVTQIEKDLGKRNRELLAEITRLDDIIKRRDNELFEAYDEMEVLKKQNAIYKDFPKTAEDMGFLTPYEVGRIFYQLGVIAERNKVILHV